MVAGHKQLLTARWVVCTACTRTGTFESFSTVTTSHGSCRLLNTDDVYFLTNYYADDNLYPTADTRGLFPVLFNLASRARISANATCGERQPEVFCKLVEHVAIFPVVNSHCDVCDARSDNLLRRHPITNAIDGSNNWWQSPTLTNGEEFNHVTVTLDLGLVRKHLMS